MTRYVSVETERLIFIVATDDRLGRGLFARRWRQDFRHLDRAVRLLRTQGLLRPHSTFVDVGANIGTTTVRAVRRHRFERAVALEPAPENFRVLKLNLLANGIDSVVTPLETAGSDHDGTVRLTVSARSSGEHTILPLLRDESSTEVTVQATTLDSLVGKGVIEPEAVGLLWVDTQGTEDLVLGGAATLLELGVPIVTALRPTLETWPQTSDALRRLLSDYTHFANLRGRSLPVDDLATFLEPLTKNADMLAIRHP